MIATDVMRWQQGNKANTDEKGKWQKAVVGEAREMLIMTEWKGLQHWCLSSPVPGVYLRADLMPQKQWWGHFSYNHRGTARGTGTH